LWPADQRAAVRSRKFGVWRNQMPGINTGSPGKSIQAMKPGCRAAILGAFMLSLLGCTSVPEGLQPITGFEVQRYLGTWHEIARLDHSFERGLIRVSAEYTPRADGNISVVNRGFSPIKQKWSEVHGVAKFRGEKTVASLKVSFFGPFYGGYHILALDKEDYQWAVVCGPSRSYFWILAREKTLAKELLDNLIAQARGWGFNTEKLILVKQDGE
jgi:apolipoprotein D and lipocalin family protein